MSIRQLPTEILLEIIDHIDDNVDRACLRIVSRKFYNIIPAPHFAVLTRRPSASALRPTYGADDKFTRLSYIKRLRQPGDIYDKRNTNTKVCGNCCCLRDRSKFSIGVMYSGFPLCEGCVIWLLSTTSPPGEEQTYRGTSFQSCEGCKQVELSDDIHFHFADADEHGPAGEKFLCGLCHIDECYDLDCSGWPEGFLEEKMYFFCFRNRPDWTVACGKCEDCLTILNMSKKTTSEVSTSNKSPTDDATTEE